MKRHILLIIILIIFTSARVADADGCFVSPDPTDTLQGPGQRALIINQDGIETMILQVQPSGSAKEIGWVIPFPAYPEVEEYTKELFEELTGLTNPDEGLSGGYSGGGDGGGSIHIETEEIGYYRINKIKATNSRDLFKWFNDHGYHMPDKAEDILDEYINRKFSFVTVRIIPEKFEDNSDKYYFSKWLDPLKFTFKSKEYFYPMKISSLNKGSTDLTIWTIADYVMTFPGSKREFGNFVDHYEFKRDRYGYNELAKVIPADKKYFLTRLHRKWENNSTISDDIYLSMGSLKTGNE